MDWIVTTARTVEEAETRALDLLGVDGSDAEIQVIEEGKTGLFGRTKAEARVRARIKPKAPPAKDERRQGRGDSRRGRGNGNGNKGGRSQGGQGNKGGGKSGNSSRSKSSGSSGGSKGSKDGGGNGNGGSGGDSNRSKSRSDSGGGAKSGSGNGGRSSGNRGGNSGGSRRRSGSGGNPGSSGNSGNSNNRGGEDRVEMPVAEQRETLETFVTGVATSFDSSATVVLVEEGTTLLAEVNGEDLGRLIGNKATTLQALEELARTAMHRAAAGRRYHRIQVDVDSYRSRRREALAKFAVQTAEAVADSGTSKAMEPMGAADRKLIHDAVAEVAGVETVSEGRDPRRYIVILPTDSSDEEE